MSHLGGIIINEQVLGHFFRYKRTHAQLTDFAIKPARKRRTPGLTRDEVAVLANVSTDWYTRIEQGRVGATPSPEVLRDLCQALHLNSSETAYAFQLLGIAVPQASVSVVDSGTLALMHAQSPSPAFVMDQSLTILAVNPTYQTLFGFRQSQSKVTRNWVWRVFNSDTIRHSLSAWKNYAAYATGVFRQIYSMAPDSQPLYEVFTAIKDNSAFQSPWDSLTVNTFSTQHILFNHPDYGELYLVENVLQVPATKQYLVFEDAGDPDTLATLQKLQTKSSS
ncbi:helix-turn-helix transcriptional regulator [Lacticaseibacillus pabuli]|uniref:Helix-turn-helix transcriptional regulator n=1 Tax=Lacticaseibacillus pabuli TaxID=3025672 RepID=A0ABY7WST6_9LACO|nr:helix-turn-helix transcriptional regulator [Lacticaseibacillus sp. KACC 23028]WDF82026.1 helix-turn-helix transcriptional regulator [Lacticaseibacillus sp. KACC 23028]